MPEQTWSYEDGKPVVEVIFEKPGGGTETKKLFVDTGAKEIEVIIDADNMNTLKFADAPDIETNFGAMDGG